MVIVVRSFFRVLFRILETLVIIYAVIMTTFLLCKNKYGITQIGDYSLVAVTEENQKVLSEFQKGDLVVINDKDVNHFKIGDSIYYYDTIDEKYVLQKGEIKEVFGDNNAFLYSVLENGVTSTVSFGRVIGIYEGMHYAMLGGIISFLQSQVGFLLFVILPIMLLFIYQIYSLILLVKEEKELDQE